MEYFRQRFIDELNEEGDIEIRGITWKRHDVLYTMDSDAHQEIFQDWVDQIIVNSKYRAKEFLTENNCLDRFKQLCHRHKQGNILPFIGAGMSLSSGFQLWGNFLKSLIADAPQIRNDVSKHIDAGEYEEAAQLICDTLGEGVFAEEIRSRLGSHHQKTEGPVKILPLLFKADVMTTNFDHVLTTVYKDSDNAFKGEYYGSRLQEAPKRTVNDPHSLLRLHGAANAVEGRVLTLNEYQRNYEEDDTLSNVLDSIIGVQGFLFMGCSLQKDRTYAALCKLKEQAQVEPNSHYAFLPLPEQQLRLERRRFLEKAGIHPIYYPEEEHEQSIEDLLIAMCQGGIPDD